LQSSGLAWEDQLDLWKVGSVTLRVARQERQVRDLRMRADKEIEQIA